MTEIAAKEHAHKAVITDGYVPLRLLQAGLHRSPR